MKWSQLTLLKSPVASFIMCLTFGPNARKSSRASAFVVDRHCVSSLGQPSRSLVTKAKKLIFWPWSTGNVIQCRFFPNFRSFQSSFWSLVGACPSTHPACCIHRPLRTQRQRRLCHGNEAAVGVFVGVRCHCGRMIFANHDGPCPRSDTVAANDCVCFCHGAITELHEHCDALISIIHSILEETFKNGEWRSLFRVQKTTERFLELDTRPRVIPNGTEPRHPTRCLLLPDPILSSNTCLSSFSNLTVFLGRSLTSSSRKRVQDTTLCPTFSAPVMENRGSRCVAGCGDMPSTKSHHVFLFETDWLRVKARL